MTDINVGKAYQAAASSRFRVTEDDIGPSCLEENMGCRLSFLAVFESFATLYALLLTLRALVEASRKLASSFVSVNLQPRLQDFADIFMILRFLPLQSQVTFSFLS